ncbi:MAG: carbon starvation protein A [Candidatus Margulisiibacteriota bacterium]|nr:carbon starvation protein A [Candidatus Margulisiibacteriota bacterium]
MNALLIAIIGLTCFGLGYFFYANFIEKRVWKVDYKKETPAVIKDDGLDYVPAKHWTMLFGHHFASIAGAGPIIGPVIACALFGWGPALLWIIIGSIFIGGVHDFSALMLSLRHNGNTVGHIAESVLSKRSRLVFSGFLWLALILVVAVFAAVTAKTMVAEPRIVIPTFGIIITAILFGAMVYKWRIKQIAATVISLLLIAVFIYLGLNNPVTLNYPQALNLWIVILLGYAFIASIIPVNILLQPRDYLSSFILFFGLVLGYVGIFVTLPKMNAPMFISHQSAQGPLWPMMFVIIACGAISGFHSLISSGTTSKQLPYKPAAKKITFGGMILEGVLSLLAIIAVCAGLSWVGGTPGLVYPELMKKSGWIVTFGKGFGQLVAPLVGSTVGSLIAMFTLNSFVLTTLDSATRIARYITEETLGDALGVKMFKNKYISTATIILLAFFLAIGSWKSIWPVFGASNQLIAAMVLLLASVYLYQKRQPSIYTFIPAVFMTITTIGALIYEMLLFFKGNDYLLFSIAALLLVLSGDMLYEALKVIKSKKTSAL